MSSATDTPRYSQNFIINTFAVGTHRAVGVTKGRLTILKIILKSYIAIKIILRSII